MNLRRFVFAAPLVLAICWIAATPTSGARAAADTLPSRLSDQEFWRLIEDFSEPNGTFRSDNLVSNEQQFQYVIPELVRITKSGRVYLGVGPEQNFTYVAALKPDMAFIIDVRRGNLDLHLLYKALFELSADRAEFVSLLFSKPRPRGLNARSSAGDIFQAYSTAVTSQVLYTETLSAVRNQLLTRHRFQLTEDDLNGLEYVLHAFYMFGPRIQYSPSGLTGATVQPTYAALMAATDERGEARGFLSSEDSFAFVKNIEARNLIVPVVGNFAGPKAIRAVGVYAKQRSSTVSTFYLSNVEEYLRRDGIWQDFCANVLSLPFDGSSMFIRTLRGVSGDPSDGLHSELAPMTTLASCR